MPTHDISLLCFPSIGGSEGHFGHLQKVQESDVKAARKVKDAGYEVCLRIDPVVRYSTSEGMQGRDVPCDGGWNSPLRQKGSDCALQGDSASMESGRFGRERTVLQLYGLTYEEIAIVEGRE